MLAHGDRLASEQCFVSRQVDAVHQAEIGRDDVADAQLDKVTGYQGLGLDAFDVASADYLARGCRKRIKRLDGLLSAVVLEESARN
jgi:hypothetical protein